jgi:GT2 family glycosyltransferase
MLADVSAVVLSHNRRNELLRNLESLCLLQRQAAFELIVVDNVSTDGTRDELVRLQQQYPDLIVLFASENLGVAGGRNLGWSHTTRAFILNLDDDIHIDNDSIVAMRKVMLDCAAVGIVTPEVIEAATGEPHNRCGGRMRELANFAGACHLVRKEVWERVGSLDPGCSFGGEEIDYSIRARAAGYSTVCLSEARALHFGVKRSAAIARRRQEQWLYNYSRVIFKHFSVNRALVLAGRVLLSHLVSGVRVHGLPVAPSLVHQALRGARAGRARYARLPDAALRFYSDPALRPDFGNVPLWRKLVGRATGATRRLSRNLNIRA